LRLQLGQRGLLSSSSAAGAALVVAVAVDGCSIPKLFARVRRAASHFATLFQLGIRVTIGRKQ